MIKKFRTYNANFKTYDFYGPNDPKNNIMSDLADKLTAFNYLVQQELS